MYSHTFQRVTEDKTIACSRIIKRLDTEMITGAEKVLLAPIPDRKGEVTDEVLDAILTPRSIGIKNQFGIVGNSRRKADRKSTRLNSSHQIISYAVFCLKKKKKLPSRHQT